MKHSYFLRKGKAGTFEFGHQVNDTLLFFDTTVLAGLADILVIVLPDLSQVTQPLAAVSAMAWFRIHPEVVVFEPGLLFSGGPHKW